jgi:hypothetical protein
VRFSNESFGSLVLQSFERLISLQDVPLFGNLQHSLSHRALPSDRLFCGQVFARPGAGLWVEAHHRVELLSAEL